MDLNEEIQIKKQVEERIQKEKDERKPIIEKHIIKSLFYREEVLVIDPSTLMNVRLSEKIKRELTQEAFPLSIAEFENALDKLIRDMLIEIKQENQNKILMITKKGREYGIESGYIGVDEAIKYSDYLYNKSLRITQEQLQKINNLNNGLEAQKMILDGNTKELKQKVDNFNNNILTIMGILIGAFAIIGFNIGGIKFIIGDKEVLKIWEYVGGIAIINLSIVGSLYFLFYLINRVINPDDINNKISIFNKKALNNFVLIFIIIIATCFIIA
jgi:hypothetical protein